MLNVLSALFGLAGLFFCGVSIIGVYRYKDFYNKIHASGVAESFGIPLIIISISIGSLCFKTLLLIPFMLFISPTTTYLLAHKHKTQEEGKAKC